MRIWIGIIAISATAHTLLASPGSITVVSSLIGVGPTAEEIDNSNRVLVQAGTRTYIWSQATGPQEIPKPAQYSYLQGWGMNDLGTVVGATGSAAFRFSSVGGMQSLPLGSALWQWGADINDSGVTVGTVQYDSSYAFRHTDAGGTEVIAGAMSQAWAINNNGTTVGQAGSQAFRWTASEGLQGLGMLPGGSSSVARDVNDFGIIVGSCDGISDGYPYGAQWHAFIYSDENGMRDLGTIVPGSSSLAYAVNAGGGCSWNGAWYCGRSNSCHPVGC